MGCRYRHKYRTLLAKTFAWTGASRCDPILVPSTYGSYDILSYATWSSENAKLAALQLGGGYHIERKSMPSIPTITSFISAGKGFVPSRPILLLHAASINLPKYRVVQRGNAVRNPKISSPPTRTLMVDVEDSSRRQQENCSSSKESHKTLSVFHLLLLRAADVG